jgi:hypothetical protein
MELLNISRKTNGTRICSEVSEFAITVSEKQLQKWMSALRQSMEDDSAILNIFTAW